LTVNTRDWPPLATKASIQGSDQYVKVYLSDSDSHVSVSDGELEGLDHKQDDGDEQVGPQREHADLARD
jgi:hypothetical protein